MQRISVMVITPDPTLGQYLAERLSDQSFEVFDVRPGPKVVDRVYAVSPFIAVLDHIEERSDAVQLEIALLKRRRQQVQIILASGNSSTREAQLVEQGIFFYFAGRFRSELVRVVLAAARALGHNGNEDASDSP